MHIVLLNIQTIIISKADLSRSFDHGNKLNNVVVEIFTVINVVLRPHDARKGAHLMTLL
jgi:hypothetical protein